MGLIFPLLNRKKVVIYLTLWLLVVAYIGLHFKSDLRFEDTVCHHPVTNVAFLKTHKCASTSIQNILMRYGMKNNLTFVLPPEGNYLGGKGTKFNRDQLKNTLWEKAGMSYDMFLLHTRWDTVNVKQVMGDTGQVVYISMLRDPVELFRSMWDYLPLNEDFFKDVERDGIQLSLEDFAMNISKILPVHRNGLLGENQMLKDFGLTDKDVKDERLVDAKIKEIEGNFHLIMIAEQFDESIILMKEQLCWTSEDVITFKLNTKQADKKSVISTEARSALASWLWADYKLYNYFKSKFQDRIYMFGSDRMTQEKATLKRLVDETWNKCVETQFSGNSIKDAESKPYGRDILVQKLKAGADKECQYYTMKENLFIDHLRDIQKQMAVKMLGKTGQKIRNIFKQG